MSLKTINPVKLFESEVNVIPLFSHSTKRMRTLKKLKEKKKSLFFDISSKENSEKKISRDLTVGDTSILCFYVSRINSTILRNPNFIMENTKSQETLFNVPSLQKVQPFLLRHTINSSIFRNSSTLPHQCKTQDRERHAIFPIHRKITIKQLFIPTKFERINHVFSSRFQLVSFTPPQFHGS